MAPRSQPIPITVLTGFLGSGKTTVLNQLLEDRDLKDTLILINEFGDIGIDHDHDLNEGGHDANRHGDHIRAVGLTFETPIPGPLLDQWLEALLLLRGPDILRVKGIINLAETERPMVIHGVQHRFEAPVLLPAWPSADRRTRLVFITRDLDAGTLEASLAPFLKACA